MCTIHSDTQTLDKDEQLDEKGCMELQSYKSNKEKTNSIPINEFCDFVASNHLNSDNGFKAQFETLTDGEKYHSSKISTTPDNRDLNRFINITVYDDNRVIIHPIKGHPNHQNDYINASYIKGYTSAYKYIATQGPLPNTIVDFWRLIWQEKSPTIVMVTNLVEVQREKCSKYWPDSDIIDFGPFTVTLVDENIYIDYTVRKLKLEMRSVSSEVRHVTQHHFTSWPDHGVPQYSNSMLNFHRHVKENYDQSAGPMTVHCSAGVGRTGTFITIDMVVQQIKNEGIVDVQSVINELRHQRTKMVQTADQYIFIHDAILESVIFGNTQINEIVNLRIKVCDMTKINPETGLNDFQHQFEIIEKLTPKPEHVATVGGQEHKEKNRSMKYLPPDRYRVYLKDDASSYIHASLITGYKMAASFIVAENPMVNTCRDFWKMIIDYNTHVIVMLGNITENKVDVCHAYWSDASEIMEIGEFTVVTEKEIKVDGYIKRIMRIASKKHNINRTVTQYQIVSWNPNGEIETVTAITDVIKEALVIQRKEGSAPITVHCSDTVTRSGIFCASASAIEKCKAEKVIDIFQVVKAQRLQKPGSVPTHNHFQLIFQIVQEYLDSFDLYSNFELKK